MLRAGNNAFHAGDFRATEGNFLTALAIGADPVRCRRYLARVYQKQGEWQQALEQWQWLHDANPGELEPLLQSARAQVRLGRDSEAQIAFAAVLQLVPDHAEARRGLRAVLLRAGRAALTSADHQQSERCFQAALAAGADPGQCRRHLARLYSEQAAWEQALAQWQWLHDAEPHEAEPLLQVARAQFRLGRDGEARGAFEDVLRLEPDHADARRGLQAVLLRAGQTASQAGDYEAGERNFLAALDAGADPGQCRRHLARLYNEQAQWEQALAQWQWLHAADPREVEPLLQVARAESRLGRDGKARVAFEGVLQLAPDHAEARQGLQMALLRSGQTALKAADYEESEHCFQAALAAGADAVQCRRHLARLYSDQGKLVQALEHWQWLRGANPQEADPLLQVARTQYRLGRDSEARTAFAAVLQAMPDQAEARHSLEALERHQADAASGQTGEAPDWLSVAPDELRWELAVDLLQGSNQALATAIDAAIQDRMAVGRIVAACAEMPGDLADQRRLYGLQAERTLAALRLQLKAAKRSMADLQHRTKKMQSLFARSTGRAVAAAAETDPPRVALRRAVVEAALDVHKDQGATAAFSWLLSTGLPEDRPPLLVAFGDALRDIDRQTAVRAFWLAYGAATSATAAEQIARRLSDLGA